MTPRRFMLATIAALVCVVGLPAAAHAQSAINGVVKDTSGAVLPGVTVEAASDVLIERAAGGTADGVCAAAEPVGLRGQQGIRRRPRAYFAEARHLQRVQLGRLHCRQLHAVWRRQLSAPIDHSAGTHHSARCGCEVVATGL